MPNTESRDVAKVGNILYLTDFSASSAAALPYAAAWARESGAKLHLVHVLTPDAYVYTTPSLMGIAAEAAEDSARVELGRIDSCLKNLNHEANVSRAVGVWPFVEQAIERDDVDLIVVGTRGRTGAQKLLLGSVAEEIFRRSTVPVLTVGPKVQDHANIRCVLFATDLSSESLVGAPYAVDLARENRARLVLLLVMRRPKTVNENDLHLSDKFAAEALDHLRQLLPLNSRLASPPEVVIEWGEPAERIVAVAQLRNADLIVLGIREAEGRIGAATHLDNAVAHKVVVTAQCPVLTVRN